MEFIRAFVEAMILLVSYPLFWFISLVCVFITFYYAIRGTVDAADEFSLRICFVFALIGNINMILTTLV